MKLGQRFLTGSYAPGLLVLALLVLLAPLFSTFASASMQAQAAVVGDWPMYGRDSSRTSVNPDEVNIGVSNIEKLAPLWESPDLGFGDLATSGAPIVADGKVYVGSSAASGDNYFAFDARTGSKVWSANLGYQNTCTGVGIGATAAVSGGILVAGGGDDAYYGLDASTGKVLWRNALNVGPSGFPWSSPVIANGRAYVGVASRCDNPSVRGEIRALNLTDGTVAANRFFVPEGKAGAGIWNSPALSADGSTLFVATGEDYAGYEGPYNQAIVSLDPNTLEIRQTHQEGPTTGDYDYGTSPVLFHDAQGRALVGASHKEGTFYAYLQSDITAGPVWTRKTGVRVGMLPAYDPSFGDGGTLFVMGASARLYALNPATGNNRWPDVETNGRGNMAIANGLIYLNDNGVLRVLDETNGKTLRVITPAHPGASNSGVALAHGIVYWLSGGYLNAWALPASIAQTPAPRATPAATATAQPDGGVLFPQTGKRVSGQFLAYWNAHGGLAQQGYPISDLLTETSDLNNKPYTVQYFERSVFELHPENQPPYNVLLSQLGTFAYREKYPQGAPNQTPNHDAGSVLVPETGKRMGGKFLEYWQQHGGVAQQGYPISDEFVEKSSVDGKDHQVQYFERSVFELHPENKTPYDVLLSLLGVGRYKAKYPSGPAGGSIILR